MTSKQQPPAGAANIEFIDKLSERLVQVAQAEKAPSMASYMKSVMPYRGVTSPIVRTTVRALAKDHPFTSIEQLSTSCFQLWNDAEFREERYAAIMLCDTKLARGNMTLLPFYEHVIDTGLWWDYVDSVAPRMWELLKAHPDVIKPKLIAYAKDKNFWRRRTAIIAQLPAKGATDVDLLSLAILPNLNDREFFIRKAIGWALRQYAKTNPDWVRAFLETHAEQLSPLSLREASKYLDQVR